MGVSIAGNWDVAHEKMKSINTCHFYWWSLGEVMAVMKRSSPQMLVQPRGPSNVRCLKIRGLAGGAEDPVSTEFLWNLTMPQYCDHSLLVCSRVYLFLQISTDLCITTFLLLVILFPNPEEVLQA